MAHVHRDNLRKAIDLSSKAVINVDGHPADPVAVEQLEDTCELSRNCRCRRSPYMNILVEQDHRW
jgi:transposase-like protein